MENNGPLANGTDSPGDRLSRLSAASLRINESLDFETVLQGALDSARSLTAARYGVMTLLDDAAAVEDHDRLLRRVWSPGKPGNLRLLRIHLMHLRRKLGEDGENPRYILAEPRVGYWMPEGENPGMGEGPG